MFDAATLRAIDEFAARMDIEAAVLLAVVEIESDGVVAARVSGRDEPLIRWEGHYFDQRLTGAKREAARAARLANPRAQAVKNPASH
jgi:hypothetical protein